MIAVNDPIEFREIVDSRPIAVVLCFVTRVHGPDLIDLGWLGDGGVHPDVADDGSRPAHRRTNVARIGVILGGDGFSNTPQPRQHTQWVKR